MTLKVIDEFKSEQFLSKYLPVVKSYSYTLNSFKAESFLGKYPIFVKTISDKAVHKAKSGAVVECLSEKQFLKQKSLILRKAKLLTAKKIIIQEKVYGEELIFGVKEDNKFGRLIMLGIGGSSAEQLKDVVFRVLPIQKKDFVSMLNELKNKAIVLKLDSDKLWQFTNKLINFVQKHKEFVFVDLNPVIVDSNTGKPIIVDARIYTK